MAEIKSKQQLAVSRLIGLLGPELSDEHNLNACTIIQDMFEIKDFYNIICKRESLTDIISFATAAFGGATKTSKACSLIVLNQIITNHIDRQKKKDAKGDDKTENTNDDDDDMVQHNSEDEDKEDTEASNPNSATVQTNVLVDILKGRIGAIEEVLRGDHEGVKTRISVSDTEFVPLGQ
jgi:putative sterol carrier protein